MKQYNNNNNNSPRIAYVITISSCNTTTIFDGAAVLQHSIRTSSSSNYQNFDFIALVHPQALKCAKDLELHLGFTILERTVPVPVRKIQGTYLREHIATNGCCGEFELLKLYAYTLTEYAIVVHLDLDAFVLKPLDSVFDLLLKWNSSSISSKINPNNRIGLQWPDRLEAYSNSTPPTITIDAAFTLDYYMVPYSRKYKPVQGGMLILQPSQSAFEELTEIIREGDFQEGKGWGGIRVGPFYGAMTIQGLLAYYYYYYRPNVSNTTNRIHVELNRCQYNNMADEPTMKTLRNGVRCLTGEETCEDCRHRPLDTITSFHFTNCQKPWWCLALNHTNTTKQICRGMHHEWNRLRYELEHQWNVSPPSGKFDSEHFYGHCRSRGKRGYIPLPKPTLLS